MRKVKREVLGHPESPVSMATGVKSRLSGKVTETGAGAVDVPEVAPSDERPVGTHPNVCWREPDICLWRTSGAHSKPYAMPVAKESTVTAMGHERRRTRPVKPVR